MMIIKAKQLDKKTVREVVNILLTGGTIIYPTDTVYGLGGDATNKTTVKKVFLIKQRKEAKALPNICGDLKMAKKYAKFNNLALNLAKKHWPGALNLILPYNTSNKLATAKKGEVGLRVPNSGLALQLAKGLKRPLISTSANISGLPPCYNIKDVLKQLNGQKYLPDIIIDGGILNKKNLPSTVAEIRGKKIVIHREGKIKIS